MEPEGDAEMASGQQRPANQDLRSESEHQYQALIEQSCDPIYVMLINPLRLVLVNPAWERLLGYSSAESTAPDFDFMTIVAPESRALIQQRSQRRADGRPLSPIYLFCALTRDGRTLELEASVTEIMWHGAPAVQGMYRNITPYREAERSLRLSDQILQRVGALVIAADSSGRITYVGPSVRDILGYEPAELLGDGWWEMLHDPGGPLCMKNRMAAMARGEISVGKAPYEELLKHRDGRQRWILWQDTLAPDQQVIGVGQDITERRILEQQLRQVQKMEAVGRLAGGIAHDFNNLLTAINGYSELILGSISHSDPLRRDIEEIKKAGERAANLTRQLLAFSRKQVLRLRVLDLNTIVLDIEKLLRRLITEDVELVTRLQPHLTRVKADPGQIEQVLVNLAINARDAMQRGGQLVIRTADVIMDETAASKNEGMRPGNYVLLSMSDTGCGMNTETMARIFEPFFTTKDVGKGTGLGLSMAYGIIKQSGGHIYAFSKLGQGSTFEIYLPRVEDPAAETPWTRLSDDDAYARDVVLVVEDEEIIRSLCSKIMRLRGCAVLEAANGREALAIAKTHAGPIHLMISDVIMPEMGGPELVRQLSPSRPEMKVIYLSGYADDTLDLRHLQEDGSVVLIKPFSPDDLARKVAEVMNLP
jgi:PAS domain S-box-containing protein